MKTKFLIAFAFVSVLFSCSSDNNQTANPNDTGNSGPNTTYMPVTTGNFWTYKVVANSVTQRDSLYVGNDTVINTKTYKKFKTLNQPIGFYSNSLHNNGLRIDGPSLLLSGTLGLNVANALPVPINIALNDFVVFKENAVINDQLSSVSGVIDQTFQGYPVKLEYTMKTTAMETLPSYTTTDSHTYTDVKKVKTTLNLKVSTSVNIPGIPVAIPVTIMNPQDVVVSYQYYSKNIGMVYDNTTFSYQLQNLSQYGITLPIPQSGSQVQDEFLDTYHIN